MIPFVHKFPEIAEAETLTLQISNNKKLFDGKYAFLEYYCPNLDCDCQGGIVEVVKFDNYDKEEPITAIDFSWKNRRSYWRCSLAKGQKKTKIAKHILKLFKEVITNPQYAEPFKKHYQLFKKNIKFESDYPLTPIPIKSQSKKIKRNDPCPCGSGKKFKKCCLNNRAPRSM